jgi:hypothetical protein
MTDNCKNGCGNAADSAFAGCCSVPCHDGFICGTRALPVPEELVKRLRANVKGVVVDLDAPLPPDEDDVIH